ncbi:MAG: hypothetical protein O9282_05225 [Flavobacterium sp.]|jgi:hypothetical protein|uniref:hypothetical protein n=1 Tax=Flavobacterium sp. TaxID=239 RepID=UPI0022C4FAC7|nr:hypothetical protein [Flavobacterium sp.]MCZ8330695.1 hypothetical protein [Flavobacterium sp.]
MSFYNNYVDYKGRIRDILIELAHKRSYITYEILCEKSGIYDDYTIKKEIKMPFLFKVLKEIMVYEHESNRRCLTIIVFKSDKFLKPSDVFFKIAEECEVKNKDIDNETFFRTELEEVYSTWENKDFYNYFRSK